MKKNRILSMFSAMALLVAGACSDDTLNQEMGGGMDLLNPESSGGVYMTVDFQLPTAGQGTRSTTTEDGGSTGGTEVGSDAENNVSTALIVLASTEAKTVGDVEIQKYGYIVAGEVQSNHIAIASSATDTQDSKQFRASAKLNKANLNTLYTLYTTETTNEDGETVAVANVPEVYVFVFCNPTKELSDLFAKADEEGGIGFGSANWIDETCSVVQGSLTDPNFNVGIWSANSFLMNNKNLTTRLLPKKLLDWENYNSYENAFHLSELNKALPGEDSGVDNAAAGGAVLVERSVARFDFKDGSDATYRGEKGNLYPVLYLTKEDGDIDNAAPIIDVQIQKMCLVNMGNKFYYLPRVSDNGFLSGDNYELCGREKRWYRNPATGEYSGGNYVIGPWAEQYAAGVERDFTTYLNFPFFENDGTFNNQGLSTNRWDVVKVSDVLNGADDNYSSTDHKPGDYKVWRYVVENVIPAPEENQVNGISTGVVFKAKILGSEIAMNSDLYEEYWNKGYIKNLANCLNGEKFTYNGTEHTLQGNSKDDPILYYFSGRIYMGWRHMRQAAIQSSITQNVAGELEINRSNSLYKAVFGDGPIPPVNTNDGTTSYYYPKTEDGGIGEGIAIIDPLWPTEEGTPVSETWNKDKTTNAYLNYMNSANYAWDAWAAGGKEVGDDASGVNTPKLLADMRAKVIGAGITIFQSSNDADNGNGYYCYYYYWNRHNDNGLNGAMGPMEFDVVRNNVYKLSVDKINRIGHPRIPENDPNNPTPNTPDESDDIYLDVKLEIVPWVVRVNSITF